MPTASGRDMQNWTRDINVPFLSCINCISETDRAINGQAQLYWRWRKRLGVKAETTSYTMSVLLAQSPGYM